MDKELDNILNKIMQQSQSQTLSATKVKNNFGAIISKVQKGEYSEVIVKNHGESVAAIIDMKELVEMKELKEKERRRKLVERMRKLRDKIQARIKGTLTDEEADAIANRFSRELIEDMEKAGKIRFEKKSS